MPPTLSDLETEEIINEVDKIIHENYAELLRKTEQLTFFDRAIEKSEAIGEMSNNHIFRLLNTAFITAIDARVPEGALVLYEVGSNFATNLKEVFVASEFDGLLEELAHFWKEHALGQIDEVRTSEEGANLHFNVYDCFECSHMPNIGQTVCKFDEGFLTRIVSEKLQDTFAVKELKCYATGNDCCEFEVRKVA